MSARISKSLVLIWQLAEFEARQLRAVLIEPQHLLLGLCKSVDVDLMALPIKDSPDRDEVLEELLREVRRLRTDFRAAGLDPRAFRRALRQKWVGSQGAEQESKRLHRSKDSKAIFSEAEHLAELSSSPVFPVHLLYTVVCMKDELRDQLLDLHGVEPARLLKLAKRDAIPLREGDRPQAGMN